jgi:hypothetical protein
MAHEEACDDLADNGRRSAIEAQSGDNASRDFILQIGNSNKATIVTVQPIHVRQSIG